MTEIPSTQVIRHWVAWGVNEHCPDEHSEHSTERVEQFNQWLIWRLELEMNRIVKRLRSETVATILDDYLEDKSVSRDEAIQAIVDSVTGVDYADIPDIADDQL